VAVTGIGGIFFRARDPKGLLAWYRTHLGIGLGDYGMWEPQAGTSLFVPFSHDTDHFPADKQWMLNLRVENLDAMIGRLRAAGIDVVTKAEWNSPETGEFARVHDPEGNAVELWQEP
jgi:predicted enzyme related to lactoylglutathione lyase